MSIKERLFNVSLVGLLALPLIVGSLIVFDSPTADAATVQQKANQHCNNKYKGQDNAQRRVACKKGYKAGYNGGNKANTCKNYQNNVKQACQQAFNKGKSDKPSGGSKDPSYAGAAQINRSSCDGGSFLDFPTWYEYLPTQPPECSPKLNSITDIWKIGLAIVAILLRIATLAAVAFVLYSGIKYTASRGNPDKVAGAKNSLVDALTGLVIAVIATAIVSFIGRSLG